MELNLKRCEKKNQITQCFFGCLKIFFLNYKEKKIIVFLFCPRIFYFNGMKRDECVAPIPGRPCFTGL